MFDLNLLRAFVLGSVQGLSEFLPISSSGHLIVVPSLLGWSSSPLVFDTTLHLGTAAALVAYFFKDLWNILFGFIKDVWNHEEDFSSYSDNGKYALYIFFGLIPAGLIGLAFEDQIENMFRHPSYVAIFLLAGSVLMYVSEKVAGWKKNKQPTYLRSFFVGLFQALALLPGISRSGATISGGMLLGLNRENAAKFSFLLSVPIVVLAGGYALLRSYSLITLETIPSLVMGFFSSFVVGILAIRVLLAFLNKHGLYFFIAYRIILAILLLLFVKM